MENWVIKNWKPLIKNSVTSYFLGRVFFLFEFTVKEDKDLIFRNGPYFMGPQGLYLNKWMLNFNPKVDIPTVVPVWVRLLNLPIHCWNWDSLQHIGNALGKFIDRANNKDQYDCAQIYVEVNLEVGLPKAIKIKVGSWTHMQKLDYEHTSNYRSSAVNVMSMDILPGAARAMVRKQVRKQVRRRKAGTRSNVQKAPIKPPDPGLQKTKAPSRLPINMASP